MPSMDHRYLCSDVFHSLGKILSHSFVLTGYLPCRISAAAMATLCSTSLSNDRMVECFLQFVTPDEGVCLRRCIDSPNLLSDDKEQIRMYRILSNYNCRARICPETFGQTFVEVAKLQLTQMPLWPLVCMRSGLLCYSALWSNLTGSAVLGIYETLAPNADKIVESIAFEFSTESDCRYLEERVKEFVERAIMSLIGVDLQRLLIFWTSADCLCADRLTVSFNSLTGLSLRPMANTCSSTLHLSRHYMSYEELYSDVLSCIRSSETQVFDSI